MEANRRGTTQEGPKFTQAEFKAGVTSIVSCYLPENNPGEHGLFWLQTDPVEETESEDELPSFLGYLGAP